MAAAITRNTWLYDKSFVVGMVVVILLVGGLNLPRLY